MINTSKPKNPILKRVHDTIEEVKLLKLYPYDNPSSVYRTLYGHDKCKVTHTVEWGFFSPGRENPTHVRHLSSSCFSLALFLLVNFHTLPFDPPHNLLSPSFLPLHLAERTSVLLCTPLHSCAFLCVYGHWTIIFFIGNLHYPAKCLHPTPGAQR